MRVTRQQAVEEDAIERREKGPPPLVEAWNKSRQRTNWAAFGSWNN